MKRVSVYVVLLIAAGLIFIEGNVAVAACHVAAFEMNAYSTSENGGSVTVKVILQGGAPQCSGTVNYATEPGTAEAGKDYTHTQGQLTFTTADDRAEQITVPILDDTAVESNEQFLIRLSAPSGTISGNGGPANVTIVNNDSAPGGGTAPASSPKSSPPSSPSPSPTPSLSPSPSAEPSPSETAIDSVATEDQSSGLPAALIVAIVVLLIGGGAAGWWWLKRRGA